MTEQLKPLTEAETAELLDWVSACQSSYHIDSTPGHRFGGLDSYLQENRDSVVEYVNALIAARAQPAQAVPVLTDAEIHAADPIPQNRFDQERVEFARAVEAAVRAKMGVAVPMTDQEILDAAEAIKAKRVETAVKNTLSRVGSKCSQCGGVMGTDHNGYHLFNRCKSCSYVPMFMQDGSEFPPPPGIVGKEGA